ILTPILVLLNGGFGWAMIVGDVYNSEGSVFQILKNIRHSYTILPEIDRAWRWGNSVTSLLVTQRGFLLGIPLAVIVFTQWWMALQTESVPPASAGGSKRRLNPPANAGGTDSIPAASRMLAAGFVAGLLPLIHAHSFIALMMVGAFLAPWIYRRAWAAYGVAVLVAGTIFFVSLKYAAVGSPFITAALAVVLVGLVANLFFILPRAHLKLWLCFFVVAVVLGLPQILWSTHKSAIKSQSFIAWQFGWD